MKAVVHVGEARGFANRVQVEAAQIGLQIVYCNEVCGALAEPLGQARLSRAALQLDEHQNRFGIGDLKPASSSCVRTLAAAEASGYGPTRTRKRFLSGTGTSVTCMPFLRSAAATTSAP